MALRRIRYNPPEFLKRGDIHKREIDSRKKAVRSMRTVRENEYVVIERHPFEGQELPQVLGWHTGKGILITHQFNPKTGKFHELVTENKGVGWHWDKSTEDKQTKAHFTMELNAQGHFKYPDAVKKIWKFKE